MTGPSAYRAPPVEATLSRLAERVLLDAAEAKLTEAQARVFIVAYYGSRKGSHARDWSNWKLRHRGSPRPEACHSGGG